jgi:hypothetical protein
MGENDGPLRMPTWHFAKACRIAADQHLHTKRLLISRHIAAEYLDYGREIESARSSQ